MGEEKVIYTPIEITSGEKDELCSMLCSLERSENYSRIASIYDDILTKISMLLTSFPNSRHEYFDDQKELFHFLVRKVLNSPDITLARERFKEDLEDFFRKKPAFKWKGLGLDELLDLAINIPLSLGDVGKIVATKTGKFILLRAERASHNQFAGESSIRDDSETMDGHIKSACENVLLPFLQFVRTSPDRDHPVVISLYAYLIQILDKICIILEHTKHNRAKNICSKILPLRTRLIEIVHTPKPPDTLRASLLLLINLLRPRK